MKSIGVFCGSKSGTNELFLLHAKQLGSLLARNGITVVYGGGNKGLMGTIANAALAEGGKVIGVIPEKLRSWEHQHDGLSELHVVPDMHTRKKMMYELCDAAIILPGGFGTMDELFEMLTWNQLSIHDKPIFILNTGGYYSDLFQMMQVMHREGFLYDNLEDRVGIFSLPQAIIDHVKSLG
ncbi:MAG TPA: TIGR00730 family Rossman fold protein [Phnomibacter sp.]|nr:TIGR00730 family Rossman fold protein [Phnomibacter sp.]